MRQIQPPVKVPSYATQLGELQPKLRPLSHSVNWTLKLPEKNVCDSPGHYNPSRKLSILIANDQDVIAVTLGRDYGLGFLHQWVVIRVEYGPSGNDRARKGAPS